MLVKRKESPLYMVILSMLGYVIIMLGIIILMPMALLVFYPEERHVAHAFILPGTLSIFFGYLLMFITRGHQVNRLERNEGSLMVLIIWLVSCFIGAWPFYLNGDYTFVEALFESTSGFTTTGFTVTDVDHASHLILMYRSILHLFGGVGLILILSSVLSNTYGMQLFNAEGHRDHLTPSLTNSARTIVYIYLALIAGGSVAYTIFGMAPFDAVNFSISAVSTGGFATKSQSIGYYHSIPIDLITVVLMLTGASNFMATLYLVKGKFREFFQHTETRITLILVACGTPVVTALLMFEERIDPSLLKAVDDALFQVVSVLTTTGLSTLDHLWLQYSLPTIPLVILMLVGGNSGSTAGGLKSYRAAIIFKNIFWSFQDMTDSKHIHRSRHYMNFGKQTEVSSKEIANVNSYFSLSAICVLISAIGFSHCGYDFRDALFESVSVLSTVGVSIGILESGATTPELWIGIVDMLIARLEVFLIPMAMQAVVDHTRLWKENRDAEKEYNDRVRRRRIKKQLARIQAQREQAREDRGKERESRDETKD